MNYGETLKKLRTDTLNLSSKDMAFELGITPEHYSRLENGHQKPSLELLETLAGKINTTLNIEFTAK